MISIYPNLLQDTCLGSLVNDMITLDVTSPTGNCPGGGSGCCSTQTLELLATPECLDQIRAQPRFIFESRRSESRNDPYGDNHRLVNRFIQLCGSEHVPKELCPTDLQKLCCTSTTCTQSSRRRSSDDTDTGDMNITGRIIPIHQAFESSSGTVVNTDLNFGKKEQS